MLWVQIESTGNLVIGEGESPENKTGVKWESGTVMGEESGYILLMQLDGSLVVYRGTEPEYKSNLVPLSLCPAPKQPTSLLAALSPQ